MIFVILALGIIQVSHEASIPLAYSSKLGVNSSQLNSNYITRIEINPEDFTYPPHSQEVFRAVVGDFDPHLGLNTTAQSVAYFITGAHPPDALTAPNWLQMEPKLVTLAPVVQLFSKDNPEVEECVFITDSTLDCYNLREKISLNFSWNIMGSDNSSEVLAELTRLKPYIEKKKVHFAICDARTELQFSKMALDLLLKSGLYYGSEVYIYTYANMVNTANYEVVKAFADAGAYLATVIPALSSSNMNAVELTKKYLDILAIRHVRDSSLSLKEELIPFTSANFLRLIQATRYNVSNGIMDIAIDFTNEGDPGVLNFYLCEFQSMIDIQCSPGYYDHSNKELQINIELNEKQKVKLLTFQDATFSPSYAKDDTSMAMQMIQEIFAPYVSYPYEFVNVTFNKSMTVQENIVKILQNSQTTFTMSAFPVPLDPTLNVSQSPAVFYDGIVMIKIRKATALNLFLIFGVVSGFIWLCVFASLIFVAAIFFAIKVATDYQTKQLGLVPEDVDVPLFRQFINVIYQNFSAVLLAKILVKPKQISIKVLYQSYWIASILFLATYAAALAEQRLVAHETSLPFNTLRGLASNTQNYRWFFLRNSSAVWKMQNSKDVILKKLVEEASTKWPNSMYAESVADAASRIDADNRLILIASRMEAKQILSEECGLTKCGDVNYLFGVGYQFSGPNVFNARMSDRIEMLSSGGTFEAIRRKRDGLGDCPLYSESIDMLKSAYTLRDFGGTFIIVLVGLIIAFIVAGIEFLVEKYPTYRQRRQDSKRQFGKVYAAMVLNVTNDGITIRVADTDDVTFVHSNHIKATRNQDGQLNIQEGVYVKATYMGNDPRTATPIYNVCEERVLQLESGGVVPPDNQPADHH